MKHRWKGKDPKHTIVWDSTKTILIDAPFQSKCISHSSLPKNSHWDPGVPTIVIAKDCEPKMINITVTYDKGKQ